MIIIDGMADQPCNALGGRTPIETAHTPALDHMHPLGYLCTTPAGMETDSQNCILSILGVPADTIPKGRVFLEALAGGIYAGPEDLLLRINFVAVENGRLAANGLPYSGPLPELAAYEVIHLSGYRSILRIPGGAALCGDLHGYPPHEHLGRPFEAVLPTGCDLADKLRKAALAMLGRTGQVSFVPWSPSEYPRLPAFEQLRGMRGAVISGTPVARGIALGMGMAAPVIPGATGDTDTDLAAKCTAALTLAQSHDFVLLHVNGADEAAHRRDPAAKADFISRVDEAVVGPVTTAITDRPVVVLSDHATLSATGGHDPMPVEVFGLWQGGEMPALSELFPATVQVVSCL